MPEEPYWFCSPHAPEGLPSFRDILSGVNLRRFSVSYAYPPDAPVCWVKYGTAVNWNEVLAHTMAYEGLVEIKSDIRIPAIYFACRHGRTTIIVMEYIRGTSVRDVLEGANESKKNEITGRVASALSALVQVPLKGQQPCRPAAIDGGYIRHTVFLEVEAPRHYENVDQLEQHINLLLEESIKRPYRLRNLAQEPMVFCFSDVYPTNFMIDSDGRTVVVDFADGSILPATFALHAVYVNTLGLDISKLVDIPGANQDNLLILRAASGRMVMAYNFFVQLGSRIAGGDEESQKEIQSRIQTKIV